MPDLALVAFGGGLAAWILAEAALTSRDRPAPGTLALPTGLLVLAGQLGGTIEHVARSTGPGWAVAAGAAPFAAGAALFVAGIALRLWSIATLGAAFASALDSPRLVTTGPYRWMRHPSEVGLLAAMLGSSLVLASGFALLATLAAFPIAAVRCRREDAALARRHRIVHAAWSRRVGWFWPR